MATSLEPGLKTRVDLMRTRILSGDLLPGKPADEAIDVLQDIISQLIQSATRGISMRNREIVLESLKWVLMIYNSDCVTELMRDSGGLHSQGGRRILMIEGNIRNLLSICSSNIVTEAQREAEVFSRELAESRERSRMLAKTLGLPEEEERSENNGKRQVVVCRKAFDTASFAIQLEVHTKLKQTVSDP